MMEVAVLGSILVFTIATCVRIGLRFNYQQELQQNAFRNALRTARDTNKPDDVQQSYNYTIMQDRQVPNPGDHLNLGSRNRFAAGSSVVYGRFLFSATDEDQDPLFVFDINNTEHEFNYHELWDPEQDDNADNEPLIAETRREVAGASGRITKTETGGSITTVQETDVVENVTTVFNTQEGLVEFTDVLEKHSGHTWTTSH
jgi:hypothetical protein